MARFKAATGSTLVVDKRYSDPGHYTALSLSPSISNQGRYGRFMLYVVASATPEDDVHGCSSTGNGHARGGRPFEYLLGERPLSRRSTYWLAKKQYGANLVLWWFGAQKKVDAAFSRVHKPLLTKVVSS